MAKVLVTLKIFPSDVNVNLESLKKGIIKSLPEYASVYRFEEEPVAFGLIIIIAHILIPEDNKGGMAEVEFSLKKIRQISNLRSDA